MWNVQAENKFVNVCEAGSDNVKRSDTSIVSIRHMSHNAFRQPIKLIRAFWTLGSQKIIFYPQPLWNKWLLVKKTSDQLDGEIEIDASNFRNSSFDIFLGQTLSLCFFHHPEQVNVREKTNWSTMFHQAWNCYREYHRILPSLLLQAHHHCKFHQILKFRKEIIQNSTL